MASIKQRSVGQNQLASKIKSKVGVGQSGDGGANRILRESGERIFKVYTESKVVAGNSRIRKSMPVIKASSMAGPSVQKGISGSTEIEKNKNEDPAKPIVQRRALADVSNVKGNIVLKNVAARNSLKLPSKVFTDLGTRTKTVMSRKSIQGNVPGGLKQVVVGSKYLKAPSNSQRNTATKLHRDSIASNGRTVRTSLRPTRKSLPVPKPMGTANIPKGNSGSPKVTKGEITVAAGRKIVARVSTSRTQLWRNRVRDGFLIRGQNAVDSRTVLRKSIMPPVKTAARVSTFTRNTKPNETKCQSILSMVSTTTAKTDQSAKSSARENLTEESLQRQILSEVDCKPSTSAAVTKKVSRRRKSYTSSLMEGHKLLEQSRNVPEQEKVASIDDKGNQLEVADYIDEIYQYYWVTEAQIPYMGNYMSIQKDITPHMRAILVDWLIEVHLKYDLMPETLYLMISLLDQYLSVVVVKKDEIQLVGLTALLLASKYEDYWHPKVKELIALSAESHTREQMLEMEKLILKKLKFRLNMPTPYVFMLRFLKASQTDTTLKHLAFYLTDLCLVEYEASKFKPSLLCASAIYVARSTLKLFEPWTPLLRRHARYDELQLRECAEMVLRFHKAARQGRLKVTYEKYMSPDFSRVAAMKPLETLPF